MDLQAAWNEFSEQKMESPTLPKEKIAEAINKTSSSHIQKLKNRVRNRLIVCIVFLVLICGASFIAPDNPDFLITLGSVSIIYATMIYILANGYRRIDASADYNENTLSLLKEQHKTVVNIIRIEELLILISSPVAFVSGMCFSFILFKGWTLMEIFTNLKLLGIMLAVSVILLPLFGWATRILNKKYFGKLLDKLQGNIDELESLQQS